MMYKVDFREMLASIYKEHGSTLLNSELVEHAYKRGLVAAHDERVQASTSAVDPRYEGKNPREFFTDLIQRHEPSAAVDFSSQPWTIVVTVDPIQANDEHRKAMRTDLERELYKNLPAPVAYLFKDRSIK